MRSCGHDHTGLQRFCYLIDLPTPMTKNTCTNIVHKMATEVEVIAVEQCLMLQLIKIVKKNQHTADKANLVNTSVSCDGTWRLGGFSSYNGVYTAISMIKGKVLGCEVLSKNFRQCLLIGKKENTIMPFVI